MEHTEENENIEIRLLLEAVFLKYGYDFRSYSFSSLKRRITNRFRESGLSTISEMQHMILNDQRFFETVLNDLSINVTEMFRDPVFFKSLRTQVIPQLKGREFLKVWHSGCASGEEVYSTVILFKEEGLYDRSRFYATDFNEKKIAEAKKGIYPLSSMKGYTANYQHAGGTSSFGEYYTARYDFAIMDGSLKTNILFSDHNLATDGSFGEMDMILCRNVLIYFSKILQDHVLELFKECLTPGGFLCLGSKESLRFSSVSDAFEDFASDQKIYRKK